MICASFTGLSDAQWKNIAPGLLPVTDQNCGAIHFADGTLWVGTRDIYASTDSGVTWNRLSAIPGQVADLDLYDRLNAVASTDSGAFVTTDGGQSWKRVLTFGKVIGGGIFRASFNGSTQVIHALRHYPSELWTSTDGGANWLSKGFGKQSYSTSFAIGRDRSVYVFSSRTSGNSLEGWVNVSTDLGQTWSGNSAFVDGDSYSISVDTCDPHRLYLANEDASTTNDSLSQIFVSPDAGATWAPTNAHHTKYFSGAMSTTTRVVYAGTVASDKDNGVERSTDYGVTWRNIGGPSLLADTRALLAINDNLVFALTPDGSVWATRNSGGDSLRIPKGLKISPDTLFAGDSIYPCAGVPFPTRSIHTQALNCSPPYLYSAKLLGPDSASFSVATQLTDPIQVACQPMHSGLHDARLLLTLSDGSQDTVILAPFGILPKQIAMSPRDQYTDTLGGVIEIPITISGLAKTEDIDIVMHYDAKNLAYIGSNSNAGLPLDLPGESWIGRTKLRMVQAMDGVQQGVARFNVYGDSLAASRVTFDSMAIPTADAPCEYALPDGTSVLLASRSGCGALTLSEFLRTGKVSFYSIGPNPSHGRITIFSSQNAGEVVVEVRDMVGALRSIHRITIDKDAPATITLPPESGTYYLRLNSAFGVRVARAVVIE